MDSNVTTRLGPLFGNGRGDCGSNDTNLLGSMGRLDPVPVASFANLRIAVGKLSVTPKITQPFEKRTSNLEIRSLKDKSREMNGLERSCIVEGSTYSSSLSRDNDTKMTRLGIAQNNPNVDVSRRTFLFDTKWTGQRTDFKYGFRERRLPKLNSFIPPLPRDYQVHRSNHLNRFMLQKELYHSPSKPFYMGSYEGYDLTSVPAIVLPVTVQSLCGKPSFSADTHINRPGGNNQKTGQFRIGATKKSYTYMDPVCGASASFLARLTEMASLVGETMRQENLKKLKKTKRLES